MKFYSNNLTQAPPTTITSTNGNALFPATNIADHRTTKVFRSTASSSTVIFDFVSIEPVDCILMVPHKVYGWGFDSPVLIEANATNTWAASAFSTSLTSAEIDQEHDIAYLKFAEQNYRFWRLTFTSSPFAEVAKIYLGKEQSIGTNRTISFNWTYIDDDNSIISKNRYGQVFVDVVNRQKKMQFQFENLSKNEVDDFFALYDYVGKTRPFFSRICCDNILNNTNRFAGYFFFEEVPVITNVFHARYTVSCVMSEAM